MPGESPGSCEAVAAGIAYGCNPWLQTMAQITDGVSYDRSSASPTGTSTATRSGSPPPFVHGLAGVDTALVWGEGRTASSDGQRLLFPRWTLKRTYSHRMSDYALEFYTFVADN